jgi:asparagine synthase (glutamine-hydrolysing)
VCGVAGIYSHENRDVVHAMTEAIRKRGPDGDGYFDDGVVSLGHRRLSIVDIEGGKQPIANEDETLHMVCNGEIYNSPQLRDELVKRGHQFRTKTDVEVILHLYEDFGTECVKHLRGMFAFAIWDSKRKRLFLARDHMGQKPMFYFVGGGEFLFASEVKGILASGRVKPELDLNALWHYVSLRYIPDQYSLFRNIRKLEAAHTVVWENGEVHVERYWNPEFTNKIQDSESDVIEMLDQELREAVKLHLLSDVRVGAFLSGGIDSSTVAAIMAEMTDAPVPTFSIGVKEQTLNELPYARMVSDKYSMEAHEQVVNADMINLIPSMIYHMDEPSDPYGVGVYLVSKLAAEHVKVVLGGDGGDESFAGYDRFSGQRLANYYSVLPNWFRKKVMAAIIRRIPESFGYKSIAQKASWMNEMSFFSSGERYAQSMSFLRFTPESKEELFTSEARGKLTDADTVAKILEQFNAPNADDLVDKMLYTDLMTRMPDHLLVIGDRMSMAHSLESRPTLVDYRIVEFAASLPSNLKLKGMDLKYILKKVAARYLPEELIYRKKQGFSFPIAQWIRTELNTFVRRLFQQSRFVELNIFEQEYIDRLLDEHLSGKVDHNFRLWVLINLEIWYRIYFEGESVESMKDFTGRLMA